MNDSQRAAFDRLGPRYLVGGLARDAMATQFVAQQPLDPAELFGRPGPLLVEIGAGSGENLAAMAAGRPDWNVLGFEVYDKVIGSAMSRLDRAGLANARLVRGDAATGLAHLLTPGAIAELHTYFPDPWHKSRHAKRRLVNPWFVALAASRLSAGALWRLSTDWGDYAAQIAAVFSCADTKRLFTDATDRAPAGNRPQTKFEARALAAGRPIVEFVFERLAP
jgi:tRNA (guanine-N7-)-methyltransferase